jgi:hypothetical protein
MLSCAGVVSVSCIATQAFKASGQSPFKVNADLLTLHQPGLVLTQVCVPAAHVA